LRPRLTTGLPFSLTHTDALGYRHIPSGCYECMNAPYTESQSHAISLGDSFLHMYDAPVLHLAEKRVGPEHP
jgi:hypothetical protein